MIEMNEDYFDAQEEAITIDFGKYWRRIKSHWKTILWWMIIGFVVGCLIALGTPRKYVVTSKLAPELSSTATNRLTSMANLIGLSSNVLGTTDAVYPMVYPEVVHSPEFIADLFDTPVTVSTKDSTFTTDIYDYILNYRKKSAVGAVLSFPGKVVGWVTGLFQKDEEEASREDVPVDPFNFTKEQDGVAKVLNKSIESVIEKKTMMITMSVTMDDALICAQLAQAVNDKLKSYVTMYRTEKAKRDRDYYADLQQKAQEEYYQAQRNYSYYMDTHQGVMMRSALVEQERLRNEAQLKYQLYTTTSQQYQTAEAKVQLETPVFTELVKPSVPKKSANSRKKTAFLVMLLALCAGVVWVLWSNRDVELVEDKVE